MQVELNIPRKPWSKTKPPKRILAIRLQAMGDTVITLPYLQYLRNSLPPDTKIDFLTRVEVESIPKSIQLFDKVFSIGGARRYKLQVLLSFFLLPRLLLRRYDVVLDLQNNFISRTVIKTLRPEAWTIFDKHSPAAAGERTRRTIEAAGLGPIAMDTKFRLKKDFHPLSILKNNGWDGRSELVVLNPAAAFVTRNWPIENYVHFAHLWLKQFPNTQFIVPGTAFIEKKAAYLAEQLGERLINLVKKTKPVEAFAILQHVKLVLSEDGGLMHMSWVSGVPTLTLFGGTRSDWARPLGAHSFFLDSSDLACGNCMKETCQFGDVRCLTRYTAEMVFHHAMELIGKIETKHPQNPETIS
jgi:heptosyltransferase-2